MITYGSAREMQARRATAERHRLLLGAALAVLLASAAIPARAQLNTTIDARYHDAGTVAQLITNEGQFGVGGFSGGQLSIGTEHPIGSFNEHMGNFSMMVGGIANTPETEGPDTLLSFAQPHVAVLGNPRNRQEFLGYSSARCDTIWAAQRGDTLDLPYSVPYPDGSTYQPGPMLSDPAVTGHCPLQARSTDSSGYAPVSSQDFVTRYNDYNENVLRTAGSLHKPLYVDVTQASYAFGSPPLNNTIIVRFTMKATKYDVKDAYFGLFVDANIGFRSADTAPGNFLGDDYSEYFEDEHMGVSIDAPGGTDAPHEPYSLIGVQLFADSTTRNTDDLQWSWIHNVVANQPLPATDQAIYEVISAGDTDVDQPESLAGQTHFTISVGPFNLPKGETYTTTMAIELGEDRQTLRGQAGTVDFAVSRDFRLPQPPPPPTLSTRVRSGTVTLDWSESARRVENFTDPNRNDAAEQPFEGYRVWKSTESRTGPWTLLGEYDLPNNAFEANSGLKRTYTDRDLVNSVPYYYAVTAFSKPDTTIGQEGWPSQQTSRVTNAREVIPSTGPASSVGKVAAVPNPYRGDIRYQDYNPAWEKPPGDRVRWLEQDRKMAFVNLPGNCRIRIYTVSGVLVRTLNHDEDGTGIEAWNLTSSSDQAIASGIYLFTVKKDETNAVQTGKFVVIK